MTTVQPGEKINLEATFSADGEPATPDTPVTVRIKRAGGAFGTAENASAITASIYRLVTTAPVATGYYVAEFRSADGGIATVPFQVAD